MEHNEIHAFAVWLTGRPASGKSTVAAALQTELQSLGLRPAVLESDALRREFAPHLGYGEHDREVFYRQLAYMGALLTKHGVPVIFDATANRRSYRESARAQIDQFVEVYVDSPLDVCMARDPKGIYRSAAQGQAQTVPGLQEQYEPPSRPELVIRGDRETPEAAAKRILQLVDDRGYLTVCGAARRASE